MGSLANVLDLCIGYNSLPDVGGAPKEKANDDGKKARTDGINLGEEEASAEDVDLTLHPMGKRIWSWLVLCDDGELDLVAYVRPLLTLL